MGFWVSFFISLALMVVGELLRPKQKFNRPKPSGLGDFQFPTADATRVIPVWWGTCKLQGPNVTWFGDLAFVEIRKKVKTGWFSSSTITQGIQYFLGVEMIFGFGIMDELIDFRFDNKSVIDNVGVTFSYGEYWSFTMDKPALLGNDEPPNGISGPVKIYRGSKTQPANDYTTGVWGEVEGSGFRPLIRVVLEHCYMGNSDTPPPPCLIGRRTPNPLGLPDGQHNINGDANPSNMLYEVMTDTIFGMKIAPERIDKPSMLACAATLFDEGLGLSMVVETAMKGKELLAEILRHVDGVIFADPQTGLYTMRLARKDYDVADLEVFDDSNIAPGSFQISRISWEDTINTTIVNYMDREKDFVSTPMPYRDLANVFVRKGQIDSEQIDFLGVSNADTALSIAARANKTRSSPLCRVEFVTNREGWALRPSSVIKVSQPKRNIVDLVCRVIEVNYGTLDDPSVKVVCSEDIFAVNALAFEPPPPSDWTPPGGAPEIVVTQRLEEAPNFGSPTDLRYVMTLAARAGAYDMGYEVWSDVGGTAYQKTADIRGFTPTGLLTTALAFDGPDEDAVGFTVGSGVDFSHIDPGPTTDRDDGKNLVLIGNEWVAWQTMVDNGDGTRTFSGLYRGALDTLAEDHLVGDRVWFLSEGAGLTNADGYGSNGTVHAKLLSKNPSGTIAIASASDVSVTTASRSLRPIVPAKVRIDATRPVDLVGTLMGSFSMTWAHRNRTTETVLSQSDDSVTPESGTTYNLRFFNDATDTLIIQKEGIGGAGATVALAFTGDVRMELESQRDGLVSRVYQSATFAYDADGTPTSTIVADEDVYVLDGGAP